MVAEKSKKVAYGSLYLDAGERMEKVKQQVKTFVKHSPVAVYFDVLDKDNTVPDEDGRLYVERTREYIKSKLPYLADADIHVDFSRAA
jgi:hypothetical protein